MKPVSVRMIVTVKRAGLPVEGELPWEEVSSGTFSVMDDVILPWNQSFGVLEDGDESWPELEEWLEFHPDEPEDLPLDEPFLPQMGTVHRAPLRPAPQLRRFPIGNGRMIPKGR
jgi:hypothetical protein